MNNDPVGSKVQKKLKCGPAILVRIRGIQLNCVAAFLIISQIVNDEPIVSPARFTTCVSVRQASRETSLVMGFGSYITDV